MRVTIDINVILDRLRARRRPRPRIVVLREWIERMDTSPKDQARLTARTPPAPRVPVPGEHVWTLQKGLTRMRAELRDNGAAGTELQLLHDGSLIYGRRHLSRAIALEEAQSCRLTFKADGWAEGS